jgi:thioredoxin-like negative regulator of GroEL
MCGYVLEIPREPLLDIRSRTAASNSMNTLAMTLKGSTKVTSCNFNKQITFSKLRKAVILVIKVWVPILPCVSSRVMI